MEAFNTIRTWVDNGEPLLTVAAGSLVALCFVVFNSIRILLYLPQLATCWRDDRGCSAINLWTWGSWIIANGSTGAYMWMFQRDLLGLVLNLGNAGMCAAIVAVTLLRRRGPAGLLDPGAS